MCAHMHVCVYLRVCLCDVCVCAHACVCVCVCQLDKSERSLMYECKLFPNSHGPLAIWSSGFVFIETLQHGVVEINSRIYS